jgi:hypothetical protein
MYGCKMWINALKYTKTCSFHMKKTRWNLGHLRQFTIMMCKSKNLIII